MKMTESVSENALNAKVSLLEPRYLDCIIHLFLIYSVLNTKVQKTPIQAGI